MRKRSDRDRMRRRVGLDEFTATMPVENLLDADKSRAWVQQQARKLHVPAGMMATVEILRCDVNGRPVCRFDVRPRRDTNHALVARWLSETLERTPE